MIELHNEVAGRYKIEAVKLDDEGRELSRRVLADWFPNLITDAGLNYLGAPGANRWYNYCQVGSGNNAPNALDTSLQSKIAHQQYTSTLAGTSQSTPPYFITGTIIYRFPAGAAAGNLSEVGIGWGTAGELFSRALILDVNGNPTTITVLADEVLDITYQIRTYPPTGDITGSIIIAGVEHQYTMRAANVTNTNYMYGGWTALHESFSYMGIAYHPWMYLNPAHTGNIGPITSGPGGTASSTQTGATDGAYVNGSFQRTATISYALDSGNLVGGIRSILVCFTHAGYQIEFTPNIMKDNTKILSLTFRQTWARRII